MLGKGLGEKKEAKMVVLHCWTSFQPTRLAQARNISPGRANPTQNHLDKIWLIQESYAPTNFTASVKILYRILQMLL